MRRKHKIAIGAFTTITIIFMIITGVVLNGIIIKQNIENKAIKKEINSLKKETNEQINELSIGVINSNTELNQKISLLTKDISNTRQKISELSIKENEDYSMMIEDKIKSTVIIKTLFSQGSGFFIHQDGYIVTNLHTIQNNNKEISKIIQIIPYEKTPITSQYIGSIKELDLALLKINSSYPELKLEDSNNTKIGEKVFAIGTPEGLEFSVTDGIISAKQREIYNYSGKYFQTNTPLDKGNSGGPLINSKGNVIGINNFKLIDSENINFALESNYVKQGINLISQKELNQTLI